MAAHGNKSGQNQCCEQLRAANEALARKLAEMEKRPWSLQSQLEQQQQKQRQTRPTVTEEAVSSANQTPRQKLSQERQLKQVEKEQGKEATSPPAMEVVEEEDETSEAPKKRARTATKKNYEAQLEKLTATVGNMAAASEQRFARLEEMITAIAASQRSLNERFDYMEQTLKPMVRSPVFAAQFVNHPYLQEQVQQPPAQQPCQGGPIAQ